MTITTTPMTLLTTPERVEVNACWAPMTSLFSRLTSAPVWARVKKAIGWRSTWAKTSVRRSKMSPSPIREEYHRCDQGHDPVEQRERRHEQRQPHDDTGVLGRDAVVDDLAEQQRRCDDERRVDHHEHAGRR